MGHTDAGLGGAASHHPKGKQKEALRIKIRSTDSRGEEKAEMLSSVGWHLAGAHLHTRLPRGG